MSRKVDVKRNDEREDDLRFAAGSTGKDAKSKVVFVDAYSQTSQRRAIAYGRARGNV